MANGLSETPAPTTYAIQNLLNAHGSGHTDADSGKSLLLQGRDCKCREGMLDGPKRFRRTLRNALTLQRMQETDQAMLTRPDHSQINQVLSGDLRLGVDLSGHCSLRLRLSLCRTGSYREPLAMMTSTQRLFALWRSKHMYRETDRELDQVRWGVPRVRWGKQLLCTNRTTIQHFTAQMQDSACVQQVSCRLQLERGDISSLGRV